MNVLRSYIILSSLKTPLFINGYNFDDDISSATRFFVAELMPVATTIANGLMSAKDRKYGLYFETLTNKSYPCYKFGESKAWQRNIGLVLFTLASESNFVLFRTSQSNTNFDAYVDKIIGARPYLSFFTKDNVLYLRIEYTAGGNNPLYILSGIGVEYIGDNVIDDTYTEIR